MIEFTPHPILFQIGPLALRYYGLAYALGFLFVYWTLRRSAAIREHADDLTLAVMLGVILGGRIGEFVFYSPATFWTNPLEILKIWHGGMSFHGGLIGCLLAVYWVCRVKKLSLLVIADTIVIPAAVAIVLGRIANFLNGELLGTVTNAPWCVVTSGTSGCRHPSPLYEAAYTLLIVLVLVVLVWRERAAKKPFAHGTRFATFLILYGILRFVANFWRDDIRYLGISTGQYLSLATLLFGAWLLWKVRSGAYDRPVAQPSATRATNTIKKRRGR